MFLKKTFFVTALTACIFSSSIYAADTTSTSDSKILTPSQMKWAQGPNSLPPGAMLTVLEGDPSQSGPFTIRLKMPANYKIPPHYHPAVEHVTVISGDISVGMGDKYDQKQMTALSAGSYFYMDSTMHHFVHTKNGTVVQLHGMGPWGITYVNSTDDPRNKQ